MLIKYLGWVLFFAIFKFIESKQTEGGRLVNMT